MHIKQVPTVCCFCGCGCGLYLHVSGNRVAGSTPSRNHPVTRGNLCVKGWHIHDFVHAPSRLAAPLVRKGGRLEEASWDEALDTAARGLARVRDRYGGRALGVLSSAKCTNEENFLIQKFARAVLGTNSVDHCARL